MICPKSFQKTESLLFDFFPSLLNGCVKILRINGSAIVPVLIIRVDLVYIQLIYIAAGCACPFRKMIIESILLIQMCIAAVAVPLHTRKAMIQIISSVKAVICFRVEESIQFILQFPGLAYLTANGNK